MTLPGQRARRRQEPVHGLKWNEPGGASLLVSVAEPNGLRESPRDEQGPDHTGTMGVFFKSSPKDPPTERKEGKKRGKETLAALHKCPD